MSQISIPPPTFDLREKPWIGVITRDGEQIELGLREVLLRAHELAAVRDPLPTVECGIVRLLVALVLDIFPLESSRDLSDLLGEERFDAGEVNRYFEEHVDRFDLFHPQWPFLQTVMTGDSEKPLAGLLCAIPSGTNALHFHHAHEDELAVAPETAARLLTTIPPFMTAGGAGLPPSINGAPPLYVLLQGDNLKQTILLNCCADESWLPVALRGKEDQPLWRSKDAVAAGEKREAGLLESLTWAPRRIQLVAGPGGHCSLSGQAAPLLVRAMKFAPGWSSRLENWTDPHVAYKISDSKRLVLRPQEERPLWRDAGPLALLQEQGSASGKKVQFQRPAVVNQFAQMHKDEEISREQKLNLIVYGLRTDLKMKVFEWLRVPLSLPLPLVLQSGYALRVQEEMDKADSVAYAIGGALRKAYPRDGAGNKAAFNELIARAKRIFWDEVEPHYHGASDSLLWELAGLKNASQEEQKACIEKWYKVVSAVGWQALNEVLEDLDGDAQAIERQVATRNNFAFSVKKALYPETITAKKTKPKKGATDVTSES